MDLSVTGPSVSKCIINITQPQEHLHARFNQSVSISCHISKPCSASGYDVLWYVFRTDSYNLLDMKESSLKYTLKGADLHINWVSHSDDGVYHCAASQRDATNSGAQAIGAGTTLTVKGKMPCCVTDDVLVVESLVNLSIKISFVFRESL